MPTTCKECRHFHAPSVRCRRYPTPVAVAADYYCGEFGPALILPTVRVPTVLPKPLMVPITAESLAGPSGTSTASLSNFPALTPKPVVTVAPSAQPVKRGKR